MRRRVPGRGSFLAGAIVALALMGAAPVHAVTLEPVGDYAEPVFVTSDPTDENRLFVVERAGMIKLTTQSGTTTFLDQSESGTDITESAATERGLLSMAFAPDFATSNRFYVIYTRKDPDSDPDPDPAAVGDLQLDELVADGDVADEASRRHVLTIEHTSRTNHNGGQLQFGPDGYLYWSTGDGGPANAQDLDSRLGKVLRIDPRQSGGDSYTVPADNPFAGDTPGQDEIWSYGFRNPWRFSFDRGTGAIVIGDVGQSSVEEVDYEPPSAGGGRGDNFGWACKEGTSIFSTAPECDGQVFTDPAFEYSSADATNCSITGGYVVRDPGIPELAGRYVYADFCEGLVRSLTLATPPPTQTVGTSDVRSEGLAVTSPTSFGEDACGRVYVASRAGQVSRIVGDAPTDCTQPSPPAITDSDPNSPANDNNPELKGTAEAASTVDMYTSPDCTGPVASSGSAADFGSPGLTVTVDGDSTTTFYATATDASDNTSQCSVGFSYTEDSTPPAAPSIMDSDPDSPANDNNPELKGTAEAGSTVRLYTSADCTGTPAATGTAAQFSSPGLTATVAGDATTTFKATATDAVGNPSACSSGFAYVEDSTAPSASIDSGPSGVTNDQRPSFGFSSNDPTATFTCSIDQGTASFGTCSGAGTHQPASDLADGDYTFRVKATDPVGNSATATQAFTVEATVPNAPSITDSDPDSPANDNNPELKGTAEAGSTVRLYTSADCTGTPAATGTAAQFSSPGLTATVAGDATTTFKATATDAANNTSPCSSGFSYTEDSTAPDTTLDQGPSASTNDPTPTFAFYSDDASATFQCKLDDAGYVPCSSPRTVLHLADGFHGFSVRATDAVGNVDPSPPFRIFAVKTAAVEVIGSTLMVTAAPGARDHLTIARDSFTAIEVRNLPGPVYGGSGVHTGAGCARTGDHVAECDPAGIERIRVLAGDRADRVVNSTNIESTLNGGPSDDILVGGFGDDQIAGKKGVDVMRGMNGDDSLLARDLRSDELVACDGGDRPGRGDRAALDLLPRDASPVVKGCEATARR